MVDYSHDILPWNDIYSYIYTIAILTFLIYFVILLCIVLIFSIYWIRKLTYSKDVINTIDVIDAIDTNQNQSLNVSDITLHLDDIYASNSLANEIRNTTESNYRNIQLSQNDHKINEMKPIERSKLLMTNARVYNHDMNDESVLD